MAVGLLGEILLIPVHQRGRFKHAPYIVIAPAVRFLHTTIIAGKTGPLGPRLL